jgi:hypothetical protein
MAILNGMRLTRKALFGPKKDHDGFAGGEQGKRKVA